MYGRKTPFFPTRRILANFLESAIVGSVKTLSAWTSSHISLNTNVKVGDDRLDDCQVGGERLLQRRLLPCPSHQAGRRGQD